MIETNSLSPEDAIDYLEVKTQEANDYMLIGLWYESKESNPSYHESMRDHYMERNPDAVSLAERGQLPMTVASGEVYRELYAVLIAQYQHLLNYPEELAQIQVKAERLKQFSIFNRENSYSSRNITQTAADFANIDPSHMSIGADLAITSLFSSNVSNYAIFASLLMLVYLLLLERKRGLWNLVHATPGGRSSLTMKRFASLFLGSLQAVLMIEGVQIVSSLFLYGAWGDLNRPIQSLEFFKHMTEPLTLLSFMLLYILFKIIATVLIGFILFFLLSVVYHLNLGIALSAIVLVIQFLLFTVVRDNALLVPLRYVNVFAYVDSMPILRSYLNLNVFNYPVSGKLLTTSLMPILLILFSGLAYIVQVKKYPVTSPGRFMNIIDRGSSRLSKITAGRGALHFEWYKSFILQKGLIILSVFIAYEFMYAGIPSPNYTPQEFSAASYRRQYEGPITTELIQRIAREENRLQAELNEAHTGSGSAASFEAESLLKQMAAVTMLRTETEDLLKYSESSGRQTYLFDDTIYRAFFNIDDTAYRHKTALRLILVTTLICATVFSSEKEHRMTALNRTTPQGRSRLWRHKVLLASSAVTAIFVISYGGELLRTMKVYGDLNYLQAPIQQLLAFRSLPITLSIGQFLLMLYGVRLLALLALAALVLLVSELAPGDEAALILNTLLCLVPAFLTYTGTNRYAWTSFVIPLSAIEHLAFNPLHYISLLLVGIGALVAGGYHFVMYKKS